MIKSVLDILEETTQKHADETACVDSGQQLTYAQLTHDAKIFGYALNKTLQREKRPVVLFMEKSCVCLTAMLGTVYSGNFYVPMDTKTPLERLKSILATLEIGYIVTSAKDQKLLDRIGYTGEVLVYEALMEAYRETDVAAPLQKIRDHMLDTDLMYVLFTSGSTGEPKGVAIRHRSVVDYIEAYVSEVGITKEDIVGNQAPFYTDMSIRDIFMPMRVGGTVCIIPQTYFMSPIKLLEYLEEKQVTYLCWVPTACDMVAQFDALSKLRPSCIHKILFSGEALRPALYRYWKQYYPEAVFYQCYGPTEITGICCYYRMSRDYGNEEKIPIGKPFQNTGLLLLDDAGREVPQTCEGAAGEICVYGTCLAAGYYNNPEKTKEVFVQNPLTRQYPNLIYRTGDLAKWDKEGNLIFLSRKDDQIKHSGRRIELGEIEAAMRSIEAIKSCCCVQDRKQDALVLYYVGDLETKEIMLCVRDKLPKYMIPTVYHKKESLPVLPNGKLNRKQMDEWANR